MPPAMSIALLFGTCQRKPQGKAGVVPDAPHTAGADTNWMRSLDVWSYAALKNWTHCAVVTLYLTML